MASQTDDAKEVVNFMEQLGEQIGPSSVGSTVPSSGSAEDVSSFMHQLGENVGKPASQIQQKTIPTVSTTEDILRSGAGGLERGAAAIAGLPGDVGALARFGGEYAKYYGKKALEKTGYQPEGEAEEYWKTVEKERASPERDYVGPIPTSSATIKWAEKNLPGAEYKPQTKAGKYAASAAELAPTAALALLPIPGVQEPFLAALGRAGIAGIGAEAAAELAPKEYEPYARLAGAVVTPLAASKFVSPAVGTLASKAGVPERAIEAVGLKSPRQYVGDRLVDEIKRMKSTGEYTGMTAKELENIRAAEVADNIPEEMSRIRAYWALGDSPSDVLKRFVSQNSMMNPKINDEIKRLLADHNANARVIDDMAGQLLGTMHDDATLNALNRFRSENGIPEMLTETPTLSEAKKFAQEIRNDLYDKTFGQAYAAHPSILTNRLDELFTESKSAQNIAYSVLNDINESRRARGLKPLDFLDYDQENSVWKIGRDTPDGRISGAPLEYWDKLAKKLYNIPESGPRDTAGAIRKSLDDYFAQKNIENPLNKATEKYRDIKYSSNALDEGASFVEDLRLTPSTTKRQRALGQFDRLTDAEKGLYQAGALQQIYTLMTQADGFKVLEKLLKTGDNRALLKKVLDWQHPQDFAAAAARGGPSNFDRFEQAFELARTMRVENAANLLGNTTPVRGLLRRITSPGALGIAGITLNALENAFFGGTPLGIITMAYGGIKYVRQVLEDQRARKFLNMIASRNPEDAIALSRMVNQSAADRKSWGKVLNMIDFGNKATQQAYRKATAAYVGTRPGVVRDEERKERRKHKAGGRVKYGPGGEVPFDEEGENERPASDLDSNRMFSPTMRLTSSMRPAVANQRMPITEAMKTIVNKEPRALYEMIHGGYAHPDSTPDNIIPDWAAESFHPEGTASPSEIGNNLGPTSPVAIPVQFRGEDAPYYKWPNRRYHYGRDYFEMPVIVEPRKTGKEDIFKIPLEDLTVRQSRVGIPIGQNGEPPNYLYQITDKAKNILTQKETDQPLDEDDIAGLKLRAIDKHEKSQRIAHARTNEYQQTHYPNQGLNAFHVRGQTISPFDGSTFNHKDPFLNIDEVQSDVHQASRKFEKIPYDQRTYSVSALRKAYNDAAEAYQKAEKLKELTDLINNKKNKNLEKISRLGVTKKSERDERDVLFDATKKLYEKLKEVPSYILADADAFKKKSDYNSLLLKFDRYPPVAPYSDNEKKYTEMAIKLMLNKAIDEGHKGISLTPWQEHILRNGFATPTKNMSFNPKENILTVESDNNLKRIKVDYQDMLAQHGDPLEEFVGKNTASLLRKNPNKMIYQEEHPLFWVEGNPKNARRAERTIQYYQKTLPNELLKYLRKIDPNVSMEDIGVFSSRQSTGLGGERFFPHKGVRLTDKIIKHVKKYGQPAYAQGGEVERPTRATGGRIPEVDKLFKAAKKELDNTTKPMLNVHDDDIVKALRIMQGRV